MINNRKYTDVEIKKICNNIVVVCDSREKVNSHITDWMDYKNRCEYVTSKLDYGDYTFKVKAIPELDILHDLDFSSEIVVERKNSWDELSQNFLKNRARFCEELAMCQAKMIILIEDSWSNLFQGNYRSKYDNRAFIASLQTFEQRYNVTFKCFKKEEMATYMYTYFYYYLRERLK